MLVGPDKSLTLGLISACLAGRATLSIITHAHFPPALHAFTVPIFGLLALRYVTLGGYGNAALGVMWIAVLGYVLLFVDRQSRAVVAQIRLRYENEQLVGQLQRQNTLAEQARTRAEEASRSKSLFFAAANHDLRQPLHSLGLFATALRNNSAGRSSQALVDQILQCTESLEQLFDNLLDISKLDAGQVEVKREIVPVDAVFDRLRSTFSGTRAGQGAAPVGAPLEGDAGDGRHAAVPRAVEPRIELAALHGERRRRSLPAGGAATSRRSRCGTPASASRPSSTSASSRSSISSTIRRATARAASGLGLATVRRIVQLLGHPLWLRSTVGKGSRFTIEVPIADPTRVHSVAADDRAEGAEPDRRQAHRRDRRRGVGAPRHAEPAGELGLQVHRRHGLGRGVEQHRRPLAGLHHRRPAAARRKHRHRCDPRAARRSSATRFPPC